MTWASEEGIDNIGRAWLAASPPQGGSFNLATGPPAKLVKGDQSLGPTHTSSGLFV